MKILRKIFIILFIIWWLLLYLIGCGIGFGLLMNTSLKEQIRKEQIIFTKIVYKWNIINLKDS